MSNATQAHSLYNLFAASTNKTASRDDIAKHLGVSGSSVPVYIFALRKFFNAEIENIKDGRKVIAYHLVNFDAIKVPSHRVYRRNENGQVVLEKPSIPVNNTTKFKNSDVEILDKDLDIAEIGRVEFEDIKAALGL